MRFLIALLMVLSIPAQAEILAVWEEGPNGLVQIDANGNPIRGVQSNHRHTSHDVLYQPGMVYPDFIYRPMYKLVEVYIPECKCTKTVKVRIN